MRAHNSTPATVSTNTRPPHLGRVKEERSLGTLVHIDALRVKCHGLPQGGCGGVLIPRAAAARGGALRRRYGLGGGGAGARAEARYEIRHQQLAQDGIGL